MSAASALWPRPSPSTTPGGDGDDVLQRAAELDADDVAAAVEPKRRRAKVRHHRFDDRRRVAGRDYRGRQLARQFACETRTGQHDDLAAVGELLPQHLRHSQQRSLFQALRGADDCAPVAADAHWQGARHRARRATARRSRQTARRRGRCAGRPSAPARTAARFPAGTLRFSRDAVISTASAASRAHKRTSCPVCARCTASAVPQLPDPITPIRCVMLRPSAELAARRRKRLFRARQQALRVAAVPEQDQGRDDGGADVHAAPSGRHPLDDRQHDCRDDRSERNESRARDDEGKCRGGDQPSGSASGRQIRRSAVATPLPPRNCSQTG